MRSAAALIVAYGILYCKLPILVFSSKLRRHSSIKTYLHRTARTVESEQIAEARSSADIVSNRRHCKTR